MSNLLNQCYASLIFHRVNADQGYVYFAARVHDMLSSALRRYVFLFVPMNHPTATLPSAHIYQLGWVCLQTRTLREEADYYKLQKQTFQYPKEWNDPVVNVVSRTVKESKYTYPNLDISILHDEPKSKYNRSVYKYYDHIPLSTALETYKCIITPHTNSTGGNSIGSNTRVNNQRIQPQIAHPHVNVHSQYNQNSNQFNNSVAEFL